jgi:hypothetical protein
MFPLQVALNAPDAVVAVVLVICHWKFVHVPAGTFSEDADEDVQFPPSAPIEELVGLVTLLDDEKSAQAEPMRAEKSAAQSNLRFMSSVPD